MSHFVQFRAGHPHWPRPAAVAPPLDGPAGRAASHGSSASALRPTVRRVFHRVRPSPSPFPANHRRRRRILATLQPRTVGSATTLLPLLGSMAVPQSSGPSATTLMGLPASLYLPTADTWPDSSSPCGSTYSDNRGPSHPVPSGSTPARLPSPPSDGSIQRLHPHHPSQVCYSSDLR